MRQNRPVARKWGVLLGILVLSAGCDVALPRVNPFGEKVVVDVVWENFSDRRYFLTVGDPRDNTLSQWFVVEPCQLAGVFGVEVTLPDDLGFAEAGDDEAPSGPVTGAVDSVTLLDEPRWIFHIVQDDPPDVLGDQVGFGPAEEPITPFEPQELC